MPLTGLLNVLEQYTPDHSDGHSNGSARGGRRSQAQNPETYVRDICPLHSSYKTPPNQPSLPYATHQALIEHANEVLELLDHEYSAKGGLLAILPPKDQVEDREYAETTLLGQLILYTTRLVQRLHNLERLYANSMDALASEAVVPSQTLSRLGPDGRTGREVVYPQDRFVLVNAGEDVWNFLHAEFERKEVVDKRIMQDYLSQGVVGEKLWANRGGKEMERGITAVDIVTRYYRLTNDPLKTIFVIPAYSDHPGTKVTREMERQPTVVSVVKPVWPERASMWEMKRRGDMEELKRLRQEHVIKLQELEVKINAEKLLMADNSVKDGTIVKLMDEIKGLKDILNMDANAAQKVAAESASKAMADRVAAREEVEAARAEMEKLAALEKSLEEEKRVLEEEKMRHIQQTNEDKAKFQAMKAREEQKLAEVDRLNGDTANILRNKLEAIYRDQLRQAQIYVEYLKRKRFEVDENWVPNAEDIKNGTTVGDALLNDLIGKSKPHSQGPGNGSDGGSGIGTASEYGDDGDGDSDDEDMTGVW